MPGRPSPQHELSVRENDLQGNVQHPGAAHLACTSLSLQSSLPVCPKHRW